VTILTLFPVLQLCALVDLSIIVFQSYCLSSIPRDLDGVQSWKTPIRTPISLRPGPFGAEKPLSSFHVRDGRPIICRWTLSLFECVVDDISFLFFVGLCQRAFYSFAERFFEDTPPFRPGSTESSPSFFLIDLSPCQNYLRRLLLLFVEKSFLPIGLLLGCFPVGTACLHPAPGGNRQPSNVFRGCPLHSLCFTDVPP